MPKPATEADETEAAISPADVVGRIAAFNAGRDPRLLGPKFKTMARDALDFYRATAHLYYEHVRGVALPASPLGWMTGTIRASTRPNRGRFPWRSSLKPL